jgi:hypothetical protein
LHDAPTKGATQANTPCRSAKSKSNGMRHAAHAPLRDDSNWKNDWQLDVCAPPVQAAAAFCKSPGVQAVSLGGAGVSSPAGHPEYGDGHCACWLVQARGDALTSHVKGAPSRVQSTQDAPFCPHWESTKPAWQPPFASQQPVQLALHLGGTFTHCPPAQSRGPWTVQSTHA